MTTGYAFVLRELLARNGIAESEVTFERAGGVLGALPGAAARARMSGTMLITPFDLLAMNKGHVRSWRAPTSSSARTRAWSAASRRSWAAQNEAALARLRARLPRRRRASSTTRRTARSPRRCWSRERARDDAGARQAVARRAAERKVGLLQGRGGWITKGVQTVLALRSKFTGKALTDPAKYVDPSYRSKALRQLARLHHERRRRTYPQPARFGRRYLFHQSRHFGDAFRRRARPRRECAACWRCSRAWRPAPPTATGA